MVLLAQARGFRLAGREGDLERQQIGMPTGRELDPADVEVATQTAERAQNRVGKGERHGEVVGDRARDMYGEVELGAGPAGELGSEKTGRDDAAAGGRCALPIQLLRQAIHRPAGALGLFQDCLQQRCRA